MVSGNRYGAARVKLAGAVFSFLFFCFGAGNAQNGPFPIPGKIEAEDFTQSTEVQVDPTTDPDDQNVGEFVGYIDPDDWMDYSVNVLQSGSYIVFLRLATPRDEAQLQLQNGVGEALLTVDVPNTGGWEMWTTVADTIAMQEGEQTLRVFDSGALWDINWMRFIPSENQAVPGKIEAESFFASTQVKIDPTTDPEDQNVGQFVGYIDPEDWMDYAVDVLDSGDYAVRFRFATPRDNAQMQLRDEQGEVLLAVDVPNTGGWEEWITVEDTVTLQPGPQTLRIHDSGELWDINWMEFTYIEPEVNIIPVYSDKQNPFSISCLPSGHMQLEIPGQGLFDISLFDASGRTVISLSGSGPQQYILPRDYFSQGPLFIKRNKNAETLP
jgi:hypothetical protein